MKTTILYAITWLLFSCGNQSAKKTTDELTTPGIPPKNEKEAYLQTDTGKAQTRCNQKGLVFDPIDNDKLNCSTATLAKWQCTKEGVLSHLKTLNVDPSKILNFEKRLNNYIEIGFKSFENCGEFKIDNTDYIMVVLWSHSLTERGESIIYQGRPIRLMQSTTNP